MRGGRLAWILLLFVPVIITSSRRIGREVRTTTRTGQDKLAEIQNILHETITGNRIVKAFGMELWEMTRFRHAARRLFRANLQSVRVQGISSPLMDFLGAVAIALLLLLGRGRIQDGASEGDFITFIFAVFTLYDPVRKFAGFNNSFQQALGASEEIFKFMDAQDDVQEKKRAFVLKGFSEGIQFENVGFAYQGDGEVKQVLHGINLTVAPGEVIAFVGPSGAGKSSLVNLIPRFFDVNEGSIKIDGHDLRDVTIASLREQIGKVTQETVLFNDTVRNNIAYGQPDVPMSRVEEAAKMALAHDFIMNMPDGYNTRIGEKGTRLSGGRTAAVSNCAGNFEECSDPDSGLRRPRRWIWRANGAVQAALANLMKDRTVFVIAHRLSTVRRATRIAVIESGEITEMGTHEQLLRQSGTYRRLYDMQFQEDEPAVVAGGGIVAELEGMA